MVAVEGLSAEIRPYRLEPAVDGSVVCTTELRLEERVVRVRFRQAGRTVVRLVGLARPGDRPLVLERELQVRP